MRIRLIDVMVIGAIVGYSAYKMANRPARAPVGPPSFADKVDLTPLHGVAVNADGRLRSFESHAKTYMGMITGPRQIEGHSDGFSYLDLAFRPDQYADVDIIYVKNKQVRAQMLDALKDNPSLTEQRRKDIMKSGLFSRALLQSPPAQALVQRLSEDLVRTAKPANAINQGLGISNSVFLFRELRVVPPPDGSLNTEWLSMSDIMKSSAAPRDDMHAGMSMDDKRLEGMDQQVLTRLRDNWKSLQSAWRAQDAQAVNQQIAELAKLYPTMSPGIYPEMDRLQLESWYFRNKSMTWVWLFYVAAVVPLLMSVIYKWEWARKLGIVLFLVAFAAQTASLGVRWYISGRWPNANMFEAVTTSAWFGGLAAVFLEWFTRKSAFRNLFALGSAVMSMLALMAAYFLPADLTSNISNKMAALNDIWLYIHTNMIILAYALVGVACVPALLFLRHRWCLAWDDGSIPKARLFVLPIALTVLNYTVYLLIMAAIDNIGHGLDGMKFFGTVGAFAGSSMIVLSEMLAIRARRAMGVKVEKSASGGAASLMLSTRANSPFLRPEAPTSGQVLDGATMVLVELSFITLFVGTIMGAIWADHSWGRPWGWDPKEVFALNTFIIFLILVHIRLKVRDKAFWTAVLAVIGFEVMMFNWIVVNFVISGLHSYA